MDDLQAKEKLLKFTPALKAAGISSVSITYSGSGDEGQTEDPQFQNAACEPVELSDSGTGIDVDAISELLDHFVPSGYAEGEGGCGTITFSVDEEKIRVEDYWYEVVSNPNEPREI